MENEEVTYQQAKEAKEILIKYLIKRIGYEEITQYKDNRYNAESLLLLALNQDYLLD